ncbi:TonB-dependent receptor plug domain-containing protein [Membranihabitans maritimus]|uniref:TonB-dependent receptor plug domain-containing protein n=1 Tax=Membranihabitans maritimus TaxID=2904244 RepID=UPI001F2CA397|nr:TonB-dependent receptor [Membranihabitans maritimus]
MTNNYQYYNKLKQVRAIDCRQAYGIEYYLFCLFIRGILILIILAPEYLIGQQSLPEGADSTLWKLDIDEVVVTAQYEPTHYSNAVHNVKVIEEEEIKRLGMVNLAEVLTTQLNMQVNTDLILGSGLTIQGISGENVQIMIDGVPVIGRLDGNIDLSQIQMNRVKRIEVVEGAMSSQYGSNASGGVINIISRTSQLSDLQVELRNMAESVGVLDNSLSLGTNVGGLYVSASGRRYHSQIADEDSLRLLQEVLLPDGNTYQTKKYPWNPKWQYSGDAVVKYNFSDSFSLQYSFRYFDEKVQSFGQVRRPQFKPYSFDDQYLTRRSDHSVSMKGYLGSKAYLTSTNAFNQYDRNLVTYRKDFDEGLEAEVEGSHDTTGYTSILSRNILSWNTKNKLSTQIGVEYLRETAEGDRLESIEGNGSTSMISNLAGWLGMKYNPFDELTLSGNLRYGNNTRFDHPIIPSMKALWKINKHWNIRAGFAKGFRAPSLKEMIFRFIDINHHILGNADLMAESSTNFSIDVEGSWLLGQNSVEVSTTLFNNNIEDRIVLAEYEAAKYTYRNLEEYETHGVNLKVEYQLGKNFKLRSGGALTRLYNIFSSENSTQRFTNLYEWQNNASIYWPLIMTDFTVSQKWTSKQQQFYLNENDEISEGFIGGMNMVNASVSRNFFSDQLFLSVGVKNLLDVESVALSGGSGGGHSSVSGNRVVNWGRSFFLKLNYRFETSF